MNWLAFDVGCIECGEGSDVIGLYATKEEAEAACEAWEAVGWRGGDHHYYFFDLTTSAVGLPGNSKGSA